MKFKYFQITFIVLMIALPLAFFSTGFGHGNYLFAKLLFPFSMLIATKIGEINLISLIIGFLQFPLYGLSLDLVKEKSNQKIFGITILILHFSMAFLCIVDRHGYF